MLQSRHSEGTYPGIELTHDSSGNTQPQSFQLAQPMWTDPDLKSGIGVCKLISIIKKEVQSENE